MTTRWVTLMQQRPAQPQMLWSEINEQTLHQIVSNWHNDMPVWANVFDACGQPREHMPMPAAWTRGIRVDGIGPDAVLMTLLDGPDDMIAKPLSWGYFANAKDRVTGADIGAKLDCIYFASNEAVTEM